MLTMGKPIVIACSREMRMLSDMLSEKILSNYQIMWLQAAPEEFLHLLTPEQAYGETANRTQLVNYHLLEHNQIYIQVLNQFLNYVLRYGSSQFTYADQVYLGIVLRKFGYNPNIFWRWFRQWQKQTYTNDSPYYLHKHVYQKLHTAQNSEQIKQLSYMGYNERAVFQRQEDTHKSLDVYHQRMIQDHQQEDQDIKSNVQNLMDGLKKTPVSGYQVQMIFHELEKLQRENHFEQISMEQWQKIKEEQATSREQNQQLGQRKSLEPEDEKKAFHKEQRKWEQQPEQRKNVTFPGEGEE